MKQSKKDEKEKDINIGTNEETKDKGINVEAAEETKNLNVNEGSADKDSEVQKPESDNENHQENQQCKEIDELKKKCEEGFNRFIRLQADFENYKKRVAKERESMYNSALENIIIQMLPVIDNMERAAGVFKGDGLDSKYIEGLDMIFKQLMTILQNNGLKEIEALGKEFDPNLHHAVMQAEGEEENKIVEVFQKGYMLADKVIRPSLVKVIVKN